MPNETADQRASRRYRRLLLAHPRWHRRLHGADMLTALLDAAAAGRPAPPAREAFTLILDGLRCRLRVTGVGARLLVATLAVIGAGTVAAAGGWAAWQVSAAPWPTVDNAVALAAPVLPAEAPDTVTRRDVPFGPWLSDADSVLLTLLGSPEQRPGGVQLSYVRPSAADPATTYDNATTRLAADGWHTRRAHGRLVADRAGLQITLTQVGYDVDTDELVIAVRPAPPTAAPVAGAIGAAAGVLVGWLIGAAAIARTRHGTLGTRYTATALAVVGAVASLPACLLNLTALTDAPLTHEGSAPPWAGYGVILARPAAAVGAILLAAAYLVSARHGVAGGAVPERRPGAAGNPIPS